MEVELKYWNLCISLDIILLLGSGTYNNDSSDINSLTVTNAKAHSILNGIYLRLNWFNHTNTNDNSPKQIFQWINTQLMQYHIWENHEIPLKNSTVFIRNPDNENSGVKYINVPQSLELNNLILQGVYLNITSDLEGEQEQLVFKVWDNLDMSIENYLYIKGFQYTLNNINSDSSSITIVGGDGYIGRVNITSDKYNTKNFVIYNSVIKFLDSVTIGIACNFSSSSFTFYRDVIFQSEYRVQMTTSNVTALDSIAIKGPTEVLNFIAKKNVSVTDGGSLVTLNGLSVLDGVLVVGDKESSGMVKVSGDYADIKLFDSHLSSGLTVFSCNKLNRLVIQELYVDKQNFIYHDCYNASIGSDQSSYEYTYENLYVTDDTQLFLYGVHNVSGFLKGLAGDQFLINVYNKTSILLVKDISSFNVTVKQNASLAIGSASINTDDDVHNEIRLNANSTLYLNRDGDGGMFGQNMVVYMDSTSNLYADQVSIYGVINFGNQSTVTLKSPKVEGYLYQGSNSTLNLNIIGSSGTIKSIQQEGDHIVTNIYLDSNNLSILKSPFIRTCLYNIQSIQLTGTFNIITDPQKLLEFVNDGNDITIVYCPTIPGIKVVNFTMKLLDIKNNQEYHSSTPFYFIMKQNSILISASPPHDDSSSEGSHQEPNPSKPSTIKLKPWQIALIVSGTIGYDKHCKTLETPLSANEHAISWKKRFFMRNHPWKVSDIYCQKEITGSHTLGVTSLEVDNNYLYSGSHDSSIYVYSMDNLKPIFNLQGHRYTIWALKSDGKYLYSGSNDHSIRVWDLKRQICKKIVNDNTKIFSIALRDQLLMSTSDNTIKIWNKKTLEPISTLSGHTRGVNVLSVHNRNRNTLISGSSDNTVRVWDLIGNRCSSTLEDHTSSKILSMAMIDENTIATGTNNCQIKIWDTRQQMPVRCLFNVHKWDVWQLQMCGGYLFSGSFDHNIKVWDLNMFSNLKTISGHRSYIHALTSSSFHLFSGSADKYIRVWSS
eukprot:gene8562-10532_t